VTDGANSTRRSIPVASVVVFFLLNAFAASIPILIDRLLAPSLQGHYVLRLIVAIVIFAPLCVLLFRLFLAACPLPIGPIIPKSRGEFAYCVYMLFIISILPFLHISAFPFFFRSFMYVLLGSHIGMRSSCAGVILDPPLVTIGPDCQIGFDAVLTCHAFHRGCYELFPIVLGDEVTIGLRAVILPGVTIGDRATVAAGAVVAKGTRIGADETWAGVPARLIKGGSMASRIPMAVD
jgi:acetyltransferase-like isoleucine patch superfamily enzyme